MSDIDSLRDDERRASGEPKRPATVTITCSQYEALMDVVEAAKIAAEALGGLDGVGYDEYRQLRKALAALRAAGILEEK